MMLLSTAKPATASLHVVYKSDRFVNGCLMATSVTHMGSEEIKKRRWTRTENSLVSNADSKQSVIFIPKASSAVENSVKSNSALARR